MLPTTHGGEPRQRPTPLKVSGSGNRPSLPSLPGSRSPFGLRGRARQYIDEVRLVLDEAAPRHRTALLKGVQLAQELVELFLLRGATQGEAVLVPLLVWTWSLTLPTSNTCAPREVKHLLASGYSKDHHFTSLK